MYNGRTAKNFPQKLSVAPNEMMIMYGKKVTRKNMTVDTEPMLAEEKNVEHM